MFIFCQYADLLKLECDTGVGIAAQTTVIKCFFTDNKDVKIGSVSLRKVGQNKQIFQHIIAKHQLGDPRFSLESPTNGPSLKVTDTMFSDAGVYEYNVVTNRGQGSVKFSLSVKGEPFFCLLNI